MNFQVFNNLTKHGDAKRYATSKEATKWFASTCCKKSSLPFDGMRTRALEQEKIELISF